MLFLTTFMLFLATFILLFLASFMLFLTTFMLFLATFILLFLAFFMLFIALPFFISMVGCFFFRCFSYHIKVQHTDHNRNSKNQACTLLIKRTEEKNVNAYVVKKCQCICCKKMSMHVL